MANENDLLRAMVRENVKSDLLGKAKAAARFIWEWIIPHCVTEDVALRYVNDGQPNDWSSYEIACCMADIEPVELFAGIATVDSFVWLGFGITYRIGNFRAFRNPHEVTHA